MSITPEITKELCCQVKGNPETTAQENESKELRYHNKTNLSNRCGMPVHKVVLCLDLTANYNTIHLVHNSIGIKEFICQSTVNTGTLQTTQLKYLKTPWWSPEISVLLGSFRYQ